MMTLRITALAVAAGLAAGPALAELNFPSLSYRTGPYASGGIPFADGYADYFTLLNERDGGIGGVKAVVPECETAYDTTRGVECYEQLRDSQPLVLQPMSTGITYQLIPRMTEDKLPLLTVGYGRTSAADGSTFPWVFNFPATYWDGGLGRHQVPARRERRQPRGQEDRARLPQFRLWQGADPHAGGAGRQARLHADGDPRRQPRPGAEEPVAADPPRAAGLRADVGLGRDELRSRSPRRRRSAFRWRTSSASGGRGQSRTCCPPAPARTATRP